MNEATIKCFDNLLEERTETINLAIIVLHSVVLQYHQNFYISTVYVYSQSGSAAFCWSLTLACSKFCFYYIIQCFLKIVNSLGSSDVVMLFSMWSQFGLIIRLQTELDLCTSHLLQFLIYSQDSICYQYIARFIITLFRRALHHVDKRHIIQCIVMMTPAKQVTILKSSLCIHQAEKQVFTYYAAIMLLAFLYLLYTNCAVIIG